MFAKSSPPKKNTVLISLSILFKQKFNFKENNNKTVLSLKLFADSKVSSIIKFIGQ